MNGSRPRALSLLFCLLAGCAALAADPPQEAPSDGTGSFVIAEINYSIDGRTRQWALQNILDLREGMSFPSRGALDAAIAERNLRLGNERTLQDVDIDYTLLAPEQEASSVQQIAPRLVLVRVHVEDTWNIILLPYAKYDSNTGLLLSIRGRDYNFFGTMQEFAVNLDYEFTEDQENLWGLSTDFSLPFRFLSQQWTWGLSQSFVVEPDDKVEWDIETSLAYHFSLLLDWTIAYEQGYELNSDESQFYTSGLRLGTEIDTGLELPGIGDVFYRPVTHATFEYQPVQSLGPEDEGLVLGLTHELAADEVYWDGNFRDGLAASLANENEYRVSSGRWESAIEGSLEGHWPIAPFSFSGRVMGRMELDDIDDEAAGPIRGILNDRMEGDIAAYWNSDLTLRAFRIPRFLEGHGALFYDAAVVTERGASFDAREDFKQGLGIEAIGFPLFARSLFLRVSFGVDLGAVLRERSLADSQHREIFVGLGHHY